MSPQNTVRQRRSGICQPVHPPDLRSAGASHVDYPTVLVAGDGDELDRRLVNCLRRNGFHALEADWEVVFDVVRVHSRPIHLLVADVNLEAHVPILKRHRSELQVLLIKKPLDPDDVLAKVRQLLGSPPSASSIR